MNDHENKPEHSVLYIVATPIGNLSDISDRAKAILKHVDWVAAEDTRNSRILLANIDSHARLISCHEHSDTQKLQQLIDRLIAGESGAYVCDAGTPGISDPGAALVRLARERNCRVIPIPGPSALTAIVSICGMSSNAVHFYGFFPRDTKQRSEFCQEIQKYTGIHVFFESPRRIIACLDCLEQYFPSHPLTLARELTKKFEEIMHGPVAEIAQKIRARDSIKGEFALALQVEKIAAISPADSVETSQLFSDLIALGASQKQLLRMAEFFGIPRKKAYALGLAKRKQV